MCHICGTVYRQAPNQAVSQLRAAHLIIMHAVRSALVPQTDPDASRPLRFIDFRPPNGSQTPPLTTLATLAALSTLL